MTAWCNRIWACEACDGCGDVIRLPDGSIVAPKLGEAGDEDCPMCDGFGIFMEEIDEADMFA